MSNGATVQTGPALTPDEEADHKQQQHNVYLEQAEAAVATIEVKLAGMKESLASAKAEVKRLRAEANKGAEG
jgi:multidrug resistance efflux pump